MRAPLAAALLAALALAAPAGAHVVVSPTFLAQGSTRTIELSVHNEREAPMTSFVVTAPAGLRVVGVEETEGWIAAADGQTATWSGGSLPAELSEAFEIRLEAVSEPGAVDLDAEQRYADGKVRWPISLTVVPGASQVVVSSSSDSGRTITVVVGIGLLVAVGVALVAWRRRANPPQER